jgi:hypothetical protein
MATPDWKERTYRPLRHPAAETVTGVDALCKSRAPSLFADR